MKVTQIDNVGKHKVLKYKRNKTLEFKKHLCEKYPHKYKEWMCLSKKRGKKSRCRKKCVEGALRCRLHGGTSPGAPIKHGKYSFKSNGEFFELYQQFLSDPQIINLVDEMAILRAMIQETINMKDRKFSDADKMELTEKVSTLIDNVGKMAERIRKIHQSYFSMESLAIVIQELLTIIENGITDCPHCKKSIVPVREKVAGDILALNIPSVTKDQLALSEAEDA